MEKEVEEQREGGGGGEGRRWGVVRQSCGIILAKLTPHSPDQSRQVGRRDGPAPRSEEETHCRTNTDERTDKRTKGRTEKVGGDGGVRREATYSLCACGGYI